MWYILIGVGILVCSILAITSNRLLISAIWLALTSALVALLIFLLGAPHIAVIELSVGAGLVTVLFVFAINISGEEVVRRRSVLPRPLAWGSLLLAAALAVFLILRAVGIVHFADTPLSPSAILWQERYLDFLLQIALIFAGVLAVIGLLTPSKSETQKEEQA
jgi:uncharacterized MnhB-related membrane protein